MNGKIRITGFSRPGPQSVTTLTVVADNGEKLYDIAVTSNDLSALARCAHEGTAKLSDVPCRIESFICGQCPA